MHRGVRAALLGVVSTVGLVVGNVSVASAAPTSQPTTVNVCSAPTRVGFASCFAVRRTDAASMRATTAGISPNALPAGYGPADLRSAYALPAGGGSGTTIAIVDAFDNPNIASDLATYRSTYGLPAANFTKVNQNGQASPLPATDVGWGEEESLDVDMVSAIAPLAHLILVESNDNSLANLGAAVNEAVALGAKYVSNSYGGSESSSDPSSDAAWYEHSGVAVVASSGDSGFRAGPQYPAASTFITAVGGTHLVRASNSRGWTETVWSGTGSGCSPFESKPSFQAGINTNCSLRAYSDVAAVADPNTGVAVADTFGTGGTFFVFGGTSVSSPIIASVFALAGTPAAGTFPNSYPYAHHTSLNDITSGTNASRCNRNVLCQAGPGWDGPTGFGTPNGTGAFHS